MPLGNRNTRRGMIMGAAIASSRSKRAAAAQQQQPAAQPAPAAASQDPVKLLKELADLRDNGILTDAEFEAKKKQILAL